MGSEALAFPRALAWIAVVTAATACGRISGLDDLYPSGSSSSTSGGGDAAIRTNATGEGGTEAATSSSATGSAGGPAAGGAGAGGASTYAQEVLSDEPLAYWRLGDDGAALTLEDSANDFHADVFGDVDWNADGFMAGDKALGLPQTCPGGIVEQGGTLSDAASMEQFDFAGKTSFTIEAWIRPSCIDGVYRRIVEKAATGQAVAYGYTFHISGNTLHWVVFKRTGMTSDDYVTGPASLVPATDVDRWIHVAAVYDASEPSDNCRVYEDGVPGEPKTCDVDLPSTTDDLRIGLASNDNHPFAGVIDEVAVYAKALESARIKAHYMKGLAAR